MFTNTFVQWKSKAIDLDISFNQMKDKWFVVFSCNEKRKTRSWMDEKSHHWHLRLRLKTLEYISTSINRLICWALIIGQIICWPMMGDTCRLVHLSMFIFSCIRVLYHHQRCVYVCVCVNKLIYKELAVECFICTLLILPLLLGRFLHHLQNEHTHAHFLVGCLFISRKD